MRPAPTVLLCLALFGAGAVAGALLDERVKDLFVDPSDRQAYLDKLDRLDAFPPKGEIAFMGDSIVNSGPWNALFETRIANYGVGRETSAGVLDRIDGVAQERVVVLIGINDLLGGESVEEAARNIGEIVSRPGKRFLLVEVLPTRGRYGHVNADVARLNRMLPGLCSGTCALVPAWERLAEDGALGERYSRDGLHLSIDGYRALGDALRGPLDAFAAD